MNKKTQEDPINLPEVPAVKTEDQVKTEQFIAEYNGICEKHGLVITSQLEYTPLGLVPKLILIKKENESGK